MNLNRIAVKSVIRFLFYIKNCEYHLFIPLSSSISSYINHRINRTLIKMIIDENVDTSNKVFALEAQI